MCQVQQIAFGKGNRSHGPIMPTDFTVGREIRVTMGSSVIGRERSRDCSLIGWAGPEEAQPSQSESSHMTSLSQSQSSP